MINGAPEEDLYAYFASHRGIASWYCVHFAWLHLLHRGAATLPRAAPRVNTVEPSSLSANPPTLTCANAHAIPTTAPNLEPRWREMSKRKRALSATVSRTRAHSVALRFGTLL